MLVVLDRDGVINIDSHEYIKSPEEWIPIPGSLEAIAKLKQAGHTVVVATNQSGIARGYYTHEILADIHQKMHELLASFDVSIDGVFYCPHHPDDACECRKPKSGLFKQIEKQFQPEWSKAIAVGDSLRDIEAARGVGCPSVLVRTGNGLGVEQQADELFNVDIFDDLATFVMQYRF